MQGGGGGGAAAGGGRAAGQPLTRPLGTATRTGPPPTGLRPAAAWAARPASGNVVRGPVGADGSRPLLSGSWASVAARRPAQPAAAASAANGGTTATSTAQQASGSSGGMRGGQAVATTAASPAVMGGASSGGGGNEAAPPRQGPQADGDGFITVQRRTAPRRPTEAVGASSTVGATAAGPATADGGGERQGGPAAAAAGPADGDEREGDGEAPAEEVPTEDALHERWSRAQRLAEFLEAEGYDANDPVRVDAQRKADEAKQAWRSTKPGAAVSQRMVWAHQALRKAKRIQAKQEQDLDELDAWYEQERAAQCEWLNELRSRTRNREEKLAEISQQAAAEFGAPVAEAIGGGGSLRCAVNAMETELGPAMQDMLDAAPEGSEVRKKMEGAINMLSTVYHLVEQGSQGRWADQFDIADDDYHGDEGWYEDGDGGRASGGGWRATSAWDNRQYGHDWYAQRYWQYGEPAASHSHAATADGGGCEMDTEEVQAPSWTWKGGEGDDDDARSWKRGRKAGQSVYGMQGRHREAIDDAGDHENAALPQAQCQDAAAAAAAPLPPTPVVDYSGEAELERRKRLVWDQAQLEDVQIAYEQLMGMDAAELEEWARAHLDNF